MRRLLLVLTVLALAVVGIAGPAGARMVERPFKAEFTGATISNTYAPGFDFVTNWTATSEFGGRCPGGASWLITSGGTGRATALGAFTWTETHCTLLTQLVPIPNAVLFAGELTFTTANGDVLYETFEPATGIYPMGDDLLCADTYATFTGGTGRFSNASGNAYEQGCWPASNVGPESEYMIIKSSGTLAFDASDRRH